MNEFFTWAALGTYAGATLAAGLVTELLKGATFLKAVPTQIVSYVIAVAILLFAETATGTLNLASAGLCVVNAVVVALAANGGYSAIQRVKNTQAPVQVEIEHDDLE